MAETMPTPIVIVEYDPQWPTICETEKQRILVAAGDLVLAVPGLAAKPIIDIMAGVADSVEADVCIGRLRGIGYYDVTIPDIDPDWHYCLGKSPHSVGFHLHLVRFMSGHWKKHIFFRDHLRTHRDFAQQYERLKRKLAAEYKNNREAYTELKTAFIKSLIAC